MTKDELYLAINDAQGQIERLVQERMPIEGQLRAVQDRLNPVRANLRELERQLRHLIKQEEEQAKALDRSAPLTPAEKTVANRRYVREWLYQAIADEMGLTRLEVMRIGRDAHTKLWWAYTHTEQPKENWAPWLKKQVQA